MRLVLLNGWAASSHMLESFKARLPSSYELYVLDTIYQFELTDIVSKIDDLMTKDTVLLGWSLGGMLATYYSSLKAHTQPLGVILLNSPACFLERSDFVGGVKRADFEAIKDLVSGKNSKALVRTFTHLMVAGSVSQKEDRKTLKPLFNTKNLPKWAELLSGLAYLETLDVRPEQLAISVPSLSLLGENDVLVNAPFGANTVQKNSVFNVKIVPGMGHYPFGEFVDIVIEHILNFITSLNTTEQSVAK